MKSNRKTLDTKNLSLDQWLELVFMPPDETIFISWQFPTDIHFQEYMARIDEWTADEVKRLLENFLIPAGSFGSDENALNYLDFLEQNEPEKYVKALKFTYYRRLTLSQIFDHIHPWEGNTWILDLLPYFPEEALQAIKSYLLAHFPVLPDGRINGLNDASSVIRAKFIGLPKNKSEQLQLLLNLKPRDFEYLVEHLYQEMGYKTELTPERKDGGKDILANKEILGDRAYLYIECKRYQKPVSVSTIRSLLGVVSSGKVNKGVLVSTSEFTSHAKKFAQENPRIELISGEELLLMLAKNLGISWTSRLDKLISESINRNKPKE